MVFASSGNSRGDDYTPRVIIRSKFETDLTYNGVSTHQLSKKWIESKINNWHNTLHAHATKLGASDRILYDIILGQKVSKVIVIPAQNPAQNNGKLDMPHNTQAH